MGEASNFQDTRQDCELAIRKLREICSAKGYDFMYELINVVFTATDREICLQEFKEA